MDLFFEKLAKRDELTKSEQDSASEELMKLSAELDDLYDQIWDTEE